MIGSTILEDLPQNLPPSIKDAFSHDLDIIKKQIEDSLSQARTIPPSEQSACSIEFGYGPTKFKSEVSFALFSFIFVRGWSEKEVDEGGLLFKNVLREQDIVMTIAHMESFLNESLAAICRKVPAIIENSQKQVTWEKALSHKTRESLFEDLVAEHISSQFRGKSIADRVAYFIKNHGLNLKLQVHILSDLELAEQVRHLIMHNGGRIDERFKRHTGITNLKVGSSYPLDDELVRNVARSATELGGQIFITISEKFFNKRLPFPALVYEQHRRIDHH